MIKKIVYLLLFVMVPVAATAQIEIEESDDGSPPRGGYRHQLLLDICAPHIFFNAANARAFDGIISTSLTYTMKVAKGFSLGDLIGTGTWELPTPAVIILDRGRVICFIDISPDWVVRTEADVVLAQLQDVLEKAAEPQPA